MKNELSIKTVYYFRGKVMKINHAKYATTAVPRCVAHMQLNQYSSTIAEVFDSDTGDLHAVIRRAISGTITIVFKREMKVGI